jgi:ankyrin repeat protein
VSTLDEKDAVRRALNKTPFTAASIEAQEVKNLLSKRLSVESRAEAVVSLMKSQWRETIDAHNFYRWLISSTASSSAKYANGCTVAHRVCFGGFPYPAVRSFLSQILESSPDLIDATTDDLLKKRTCLHIAVAEKDHMLVDLILQKGANATIPDRDGKTAWELAFEDSQDMSMKFFIAHRSTAEARDHWIRCHEAFPKHRHRLKRLSLEEVGKMDRNEHRLFVVPANKVSLL